MNYATKNVSTPLLTGGDEQPMTKNASNNLDSANHWERFAEADPYLYILTSLKRSDPKVFWQSGAQIVQTELLPLVRAHAIQSDIALEIGSGIGRIALPLASHFRKVIGVDIAAGMVKKASSCAHDNAVRNTSFMNISGPEDLLQRAGDYAGKCNLIYSLLVFQHIPAFPMIEGYLHVVRVLLHAKGFAYLQFDTRPEDFFYRIKTRMPDVLLPRFWRRGIRRIRRTPEEIEACARRAGLEIIGELAPRSPYHRYILRPAPQCRI